MSVLRTTSFVLSWLLVLGCPVSGPPPGSTDTDIGGTAGGTADGTVGAACGEQDECQFDSDCPSSGCDLTTCTCEPISGCAGGECDETSDCAAGSFCNADTCLCTGADCSGFDECDEHADCDGNVCDFLTCECTNPACTTSNECVSGSGCTAVDPALDCDLSSCTCFAPACEASECDAHGDCGRGATCDFATCACTGGPPTCVVEDPQDIGLEPDGAMELDISCVDTAVSTMGQRWVRVTFYGPWLPPEVLYSWFIEVLATAVGGPIGTFTRERHDGVDDTYVGGSLLLDQVTFVPEANGFLLVFDASLTEEIVSLLITAGMLLTPDATFHTDEVEIDPLPGETRDP